MQVCFLNSFGTHSLISTEIKQKDIDLKDYYVSIRSAEIDGQTEDWDHISFWLRERLQEEFTFFYDT